MLRLGSCEDELRTSGHQEALLSHQDLGMVHPLQCSCLENPRDGGAWWAAVYGVAQGRTRLKRLSSSSSSSSRETGVTRGKELAQGPASGSMPPRYPQSRDTRLRTLKVCYSKELNDVRMRHTYASQNNIMIIIAITTNGNSNRHN